MTLGEVIERLTRADQAKVVKRGFSEPHSYRGYYDELAFEPADEITVAEMLTAAKSALNNTYTGYKGGDFTMNEYTNCWIANWGSCGDGMSNILFDYMLGEI